jgi:hypothetical protein
MKASCAQLQLRCCVHVIDETNPKYAFICLRDDTSAVRRAVADASAQRTGANLHSNIEEISGIPTPISLPDREYGIWVGQVLFSHLRILLARHFSSALDRITLASR